MSLHDEHLQQALRHAPDSEQMPDAATRNAVLAYADHVLKSHQKTWLSRLTDGLHEWHISSWQLASMGSVVVAVLVVADMDSLCAYRDCRKFRQSTCRGCYSW
jgi:hypothetical protein